MSSVNGERDGSRILPQSMRHKRILDRAADDPDASLEDIAEAVPTATADLVENVLEKYGDPAEDLPMPSSNTETTLEDDNVPSVNEDVTTEETDEPPAVNGETPEKADGTSTNEEDSLENSDMVTTSDGSHASDAHIASVETKGYAHSDTGTPSGEDVFSEEPPDSEILQLSELSDRERETLSAIAEHPEATQQELGEMLGVTAATVSNRVNGIEGIEWTNRRAIITDLPIDEAPMDRETDTDSTRSIDDEPALNHLTDRVTELEKRVADRESPSDTTIGLDDPELARKVSHACLQSDQISSDEELRLLEIVLQ